jgi:hypothetical protein
VAQNFWELLMRQHGGAITVPHFPHGLAENSIPSSLLSEKNSNCQVVYRVHFPPVRVFLLCPGLLVDGTQYVLLHMGWTFDAHVIPPSQAFSAFYSEQR